MAKLKAKVFQTKWYHHLIVRFNWVLLILVVLVLFISEYNYIIKPAIEMKKPGGVLDAKFYKTGLEEEKKYLEGLKALKTEIDKIEQANLERLNEVISSGSNLPDVLNQVYLLVEKYQLRIENFSINSQGGVTTINLSLANSNYQIFKQFLTTVEDNIQIMDITDLSLAEDQGSFKITIKTYYQE